MTSFWLLLLLSRRFEMTPGSHREPVHTHVPDGRPDANYGYVEIVDHDMERSEPVLMQPGDLLVRFPSPIDTGNEVNDRVAMEWYVARDEYRLPLEAPGCCPSPAGAWCGSARGPVLYSCAF